MVLCADTLKKELNKNTTNTFSIEDQNRFKIQKEKMLLCTLPQGSESRPINRRMTRGTALWHLLHSGMALLLGKPPLSVAEVGDFVDCVYTVRVLLEVHLKGTPNKVVDICFHAGSAGSNLAARLRANCQVASWLDN